MPDGKRKRRHHGSRSRRLWYAQHRAIRFRRRFGLDSRRTAAEGSRQTL